MKENSTVGLSVERTKSCVWQLGKDMIGASKATEDTKLKLSTVFIFQKLDKGIHVATLHVQDALPSLPTPSCLISDNRCCR